MRGSGSDGVVRVRGGGRSDGEVGVRDGDRRWEK